MQGAWAQITFPIVYDDVWDGVTKTKPVESGDYVIINRASDLAYIRDHWDDDADNGRVYRAQKISLNANLDMNWNVSWIPFGKSETYNVFIGEFYGNNHTIRIHIWGTDDNEQGLFLNISGTVQDLHLTGKIEVGNAASVGGIACENGGTIRNCWVSADISSTHYSSSTDADLGGIAGLNTYPNFDPISLISLLSSPFSQARLPHWVLQTFVFRRNGIFLYFSRS